MKEYTNIKEQLKKLLKEDRYIHTLATQREAVRLAKHYDVDPEKASIAALLHDCAKNMDTKVMLDILRKQYVKLDEIELANTALLHGKAGRIVAKYRFNVTDEDVLSAIEYHTTGKENMTMLQKIVFLADVIEETRTYEGVDEVREVAYQSIDKAIVMSLNRTILSILKNGKLLHPDTVKARNYLIMEREKRNKE
ncbi:bis(5'-nucleosyl)-tetraphosphatase (symmetrical) YqeK [Anaerofustis sp.]|uniref:bis(5'-nucleosyl)-tetraphosphatase (symmetrical) YqeK n=1 Tax=Anaerofustis sp. TaxID=1872517 RepID=UPI0025B7ED98|nr:bis(5'-nucleosyl)-tetraphosphatase (symmetrical) YqeK [Anaerofustis sp.]